MLFSGRFILDKAYIGFSSKKEDNTRSLYMSNSSKTAHVVAKTNEGRKTEFDVLVRIDTPKEVEYMRHGGILQYVLRQLA